MAGFRRKISGETLYDVLGLTKLATRDDIKKAYLELKKQYTTAESDTSKSEKLKDLYQAYHVLIDHRRRNIYDTYGDIGLFLSERVGVENIYTYFVLTNNIWKGIVSCVCCLSCCCCGFCCNFCCNQCTPRDRPDVGDYGFLKENDEEDDSLVSEPKAVNASDQNPNDMNGGQERMEDMHIKNLPRDVQSFDKLFRRYAGMGSDNSEQISVYNGLKWLQEAGIIQTFEILPADIEIAFKSINSLLFNKEDSLTQSIIMQKHEFQQFISLLESAKGQRAGTFLMLMVKDTLPILANATHVESD